MTLAAELIVPAEHPALPGHFPGEPIVPGVLLLDHAIALLERNGWRVEGIANAKFSEPLRPGMTCTAELTPQGERMTLTCRADGRTIVTALIEVRRQP